MGKRVAGPWHSPVFVVSLRARRQGGGRVPSASVVIRFPRAILACFVLPVTLALGASCSEDPKTPPAGAVDAGHSGHDVSSSPIDAAPAEAAIRCSAAELAANDKTDGGLVEIVFAQGANPVQYTNRCATVKVGATIRFTGSFRQHPLEPAGGDRPNPIPRTETEAPGGSLAVTMPGAGTFGFQCQFHPTLMYGAIRVVP
jgi:plastocyanin